jgi:hypothetical protein
MKHNFIIRIYKDETRNPILSDLSDITISDITIISKPTKFGKICEHNGNKKKFKYTFNLNKQFNYASGSHSSPNLSFKGEYIDITVKNFPRFPVFTQCKYQAKNIMNGYNVHLNNGFPIQLLYRKIEIIII